MVQTIYASDLRSAFRKCDSLCRPTSSGSIVGNIALRELKVDNLARQALVNLRVCIESVIHTSALLFVKYHFQYFAGILLGADPLTNDLNRVDEVVQNSVVDGGQGSCARTLLLEQATIAGEM